MDNYKKSVVPPPNIVELEQQATQTTEQLRTQITQHECDSYVQHVQDFVSELDQKTESFRAMQQSHDKHQQQMAQLQQRLDLEVQEHKFLMKQMRIVETSYNSIQDRSSKLGRQLAESENENSRLLSEERQFRQTSDNLNAKIASLGEKLKKSEDKSLSEEQMIADLQEKLVAKQSMLESDLQAQSAQLTSYHVAGLHKALDLNKMTLEFEKTSKEISKIPGVVLEEAPVLLDKENQEIVRLNAEIASCKRKLEEFSKGESAQDTLSALDGPSTEEDMARFKVKLLPSAKIS